MPLIDLDILNKLLDNTANYAAEAWLTVNGYSYGSSDCMGAQGIVKSAGVYTLSAKYVWFSA